LSWSVDVALARRRQAAVLAGAPWQAHLGGESLSTFDPAARERDAVGMESETEEGSTAGPDNPRLEQALEHPLRARMLAEFEQKTHDECAGTGRGFNTSLSRAAYHHQVLAELGGMCTRDSRL